MIGVQCEGEEGAREGADGREAISVVKEGQVGREREGVFVEVDSQSQQCEVGDGGWKGVDDIGSVVDMDLLEGGRKRAGEVGGSTSEEGEGGREGGM